MAKNKLKVDCKHELRSAQAINYVNDALCLLPLEYLACLECYKTWIFNPKVGEMVVYPSPAAEKLLEHVKLVADKCREPQLIVPEEKKIIV